VFDILDRVIQGYEAASAMKQQESAGDSGEDMFTKCARLARKMKENWLARSEANAEPPAVAPGGTFGAPTDGDTFGPPAVLLDDSEAWMSSFFEMNWEP